jgi:hypothetical protein
VATTLPANYQTELAKKVNTPNVIVEIEADSGTIKIGFYHGGFTDVIPALNGITPLQNKLDPSKGFATRGRPTFSIIGSEVFKPIIKDEYLNARTITFKAGFVADGFAYSDYIEFYSGDFVDWDRKGEILTIKAADTLASKGTMKIPAPADTTLLSTIRNYQNMNAIDITLDMLKDADTLAIPAARVDTTNMEAVRDDWIDSIFDRVLIEPEKANDHFNELQRDAGFFLFHNNEKIDITAFAPLKPGVSIDTMSDNGHILGNSLTQNGGYLNNFWNRILVYIDYDESGQDDIKNYEHAELAADAVSQGATKNNEVSTLIIKSKWVRSRTYTQPSNVTGVTIYHMSRANASGVPTGTLTWTVATSTLQWTAPGGAIGASIEITVDGQFQLIDANNNASIRVVVDFSALPVGDQTDDITITALNGDIQAQTLAKRTLRRFTNPVTTVKWSTDINEINNGTVLRKPGDFILMTTDEAFERGQDTWVDEQLMITSIRPNFMKRIIEFEAIETTLAGSAYESRVGFWAPNSHPDYDASDEEEKKYGFWCDAGEKLGAADDEPRVWW